MGVESVDQIVKVVRVEIDLSVPPGYAADNLGLLLREPNLVVQTLEIRFGSKMVGFSDELRIFASVTNHPPVVEPRSDDQKEEFDRVHCLLHTVRNQPVQVLFYRLAVREIVRRIEGELGLGVA
ncbi:MAG: hypothetical protein JXA57_07960 [Armatimonadetes bacterium]|nr:hypothetical protein [Armatimonadota bacterium]